MRILSVILLVLCTSFYPNKNEFKEIDMLMYKIQCKAEVGELDKEKILIWLQKQECNLKQCKNE